MNCTFLRKLDEAHLTMKLKFKWLEVFTKMLSD